MSHCVFIAADCPLPDVMPEQDDLLQIDVDTGTIFDGGADDNYYLLHFDEVNLYCKKKYGVYLELPQWTEGRAEKILDYIKMALMRTESVEIWNVWLSGNWEWEDRPHICKQIVRMNDLTVDDLREIVEAENWKVKDHIRPWFYSIEILRS